MTNRNESIIKKIKGLLAIANDEKNDEESQSAFIMAQRLMMKHDISMNDVGTTDKEIIEEGKVTVHKKLYWWERRLAQIISENFRVKFFYNSKVLQGNKKAKRAIVFLGFNKDVDLAKEMYILAYDVLVFYSKQFVDNQYEETNLPRLQRITADYKNSYMRGFLEGMSLRFEEQVKEMQEEYGLMLLLPEEVKQTYEERFKDSKSISFEMPAIEEIQAFQQGYTDGNKVDYTRSTIDDEVFV